ncbi:hypothetical protein E1A91_A07G087100v1 [Gossypium mustelinum]|uniref:Uncharacterized protein n=1 Tax=Gossypium mustelinum TaxID=34275 RepID=A0A5D2YLM1_GOSMU|nr:hypothetical protein E1A91_A07G087100v1 [Gossypium mustelinum]
MEAPSLSVRKGAWTEEEDILLKKCIEKYGEGTWHRVPFRAGLNRCRKSCRLRWLNYLKPDIKRGAFADDEVDLMIRLHNLLGNRWSLIAGRLPGRTANDVKNYWNTYLRKKMVKPSPKLNIEVIKPRPLNLSVPLDKNNNNNNNDSDHAAASTPASNSLVSSDSGNNSSYDFSNDNNEIMWWKNMLMNEDEPQGFGNNINHSASGDQFINEALGDVRTQVVEEDNYGTVDELFIDFDLWNMLNP